MTTAPLVESATRPRFEITQGSHHGSELSIENAAAINQNLNIVVYGYDHGEKDLQSSELAYDSAREIVDSLDPARGDMLFTEIIGHDGVYPGTESGPCSEGFVETLRDTRTLIPGSYMVQLARARGIPVVAADMDREAVKEFGRFSLSSDPAADARRPGWQFGPLFHTVREKQAAYTLKDRAVEALPELKARADQGLEAPTYALAYGADHLAGVTTLGEGTSAGLGTVLEGIGLEAELREMGSDRTQAMAHVAMGRAGVEFDDFV